MYLAEIGQIMFQYKTGSLPDVFNEKFLRRNQVHDYDTRKASCFLVPRCKTNIIKTFLVSIPRSLVFLIRLVQTW